MKVIKVFALTVIWFLLSSTLSEAQPISIKIDSLYLSAQAEIMLKTFLQKDYKTFITFTYPKLVSMMGGEEKLKTFLDKSILEMKEEGFTFDSCSIGTVQQVVNAKQEIHALLPQHLFLKSKEGILTVNSYLLAISTSGTKWHFIDAGNLTPEMLKAVLPNFNPELKIPEKQLPIFTPYQ